jgi:hypothetical protein
VAVKKAVRNGAASPLAVATGNMSSPVPTVVNASSANKKRRDGRPRNRFNRPILLGVDSTTTGWISCDRGCRTIRSRGLWGTATYDSLLGNYGNDRLPQDGLYTSAPYPDRIQLFACSYEGLQITHEPILTSCYHLASPRKFLMVPVGPNEHYQGPNGLLRKPVRRSSHNQGR